MRLRIVSDIHCDVNIHHKTEYDYKDDFVICCGDISGDRFSTEEWVKRNIRKGIFIGGNHLGYNEVTNDENDSLTLSIKYLQEKFNKPPIYFLENQSVLIQDIVFIGCILFTDFNLYNNPTFCKEVTSAYLNDYNYVKIIKNGKIKRITPSEQVYLHNKSVQYIRNVCKKNQDRKIVIITHHAPSIKSLPDKYKNIVTSAGYASNLEKLIQQFDNIKLWCHGHTHDNCDYTLHNTRIICNPRGYYEENLNFREGGVIVDTDEL